MNLKKRDAVAITALVVLMAGSHIFANQAFAISTIAFLYLEALLFP